MKGKLFSKIIEIGITYGVFYSIASHIFATFHDTYRCIEHKQV